MPASKAERRRCNAQVHGSMTAAVLAGCLAAALLLVHLSPTVLALILASHGLLSTPSSPLLSIPFFCPTCRMWVMNAAALRLSSSIMSAR